jgi:hypothetical protein
MRSLEGGKGEGGEQGPGRDEPALHLGRQTNRHKYIKQWNELIDLADWTRYVGQEDGQDVGLSVVPCPDAHEG